LNKTIRKLGHFTFRGTRKFVAEPAEALLICRMAWWVTVLSIAARCCSLPRALTIVAGKGTNRTRPEDTAVQERLARSIDLLLSTDLFLFKPSCWKRAAVLHRYLARHGIATRIIFGVRNDLQGQVAGHAWLEADGEPILETAPPEYVVTYRFPSTGEAEPRLTSGGGAEAQSWYFFR
jgi:hypothetical protein